MKNIFMLFRKNGKILAIFDRMKAQELLTCRICGRNGLFHRFDAPVKRKHRVICENGVGFTHLTINGKHAIVNIDDDQVFQEPARVLMLEV